MNGRFLVWNAVGFFQWPIISVLAANLSRGVLACANKTTSRRLVRLLMNFVFCSHIFQLKRNDDHVSFDDVVSNTLLFPIGSIGLVYLPRKINHSCRWIYRSSHGSCELFKQNHVFLVIRRTMSTAIIEWESNGTNAIPHKETIGLKTGLLRTPVGFIIPDNKALVRAWGWVGGYLT